MSPPSPRRSSRARPTVASSQPPPASSTSSGNNSTTSAGRNERSSRVNKAQSPVKSEASMSRTAGADDDDQSSVDKPIVPTTRRSNRRQIEEQSLAIAAVTEDFEEDDEDEEDDEVVSGSIVDEDGETTRCVCGFQDYPGPPIDFNAPTGHASRGSRSHNITIAVTEVGEEGTEPGSLFIQCDSCKVWQHGGCVGILSDAATPKDYFCERCRPDFHSLGKNPEGQRYSRYLPVSKPQKPHRRMSISQDWPRDPDKALRVPEQTKRRSTMNSRAAYDEEEVLRKVLEESKVDGQSVSGENSASRKGKRTREDSEDVRSDIKRQRTHSVELSSDESNPDSPGMIVELDEMGRKKQTPRGAAAKSQREKEIREREKERAEAASKRKGRADRRRGEELDIPDEGGRLNDKLSMDEANGSIAPDADSVVSAAISKRNGRSGGKRRGKGTDHDSPAPKNGSPKDGDDVGSPAESTGTGVHGNGTIAPPSRRGRAGTNGHREPTMSELKKRAAMMLEFIAHSRMELERTESQGLDRSATGSEAAGLGGDLASRLEKWQHEFTMEVMTGSGDASSGQ